MARWVESALLSRMAFELRDGPSVGSEPADGGHPPRHPFEGEETAAQHGQREDHQVGQNGGGARRRGLHGNP